MKNSAEPWNKGRAIGQKRPFTIEQIAQITRTLQSNKQFRDLCLFCLGIDTMLRSADLVRLSVADVMNANGELRKEIAWVQGKTRNPVKSAITPYTESAIACWIASAKLQQSDYLFTAKRGDRTSSLSANYLRRLVKKWATMIGLDPADYAGHSLRRTKPAFMYARGVQPPSLRLLLGQKSLESTQAYLGIDQNEALALARKFDCFKEES